MEAQEQKILILTGIFLILITATATVRTYKQIDAEYTWKIEKTITTELKQHRNLSNELNKVGENQSYQHLSNITSAPSNRPNIILISLDGFSRQRFNELKNNLTTFHSLLMSGWVQLNVTNYAYYTQTRNGHATMLSGYMGKTTGIMGNNYVYHQLPVGYTFLEKAEKLYGQTSIATAFISGKYKNIYPAFNQTALETLDYVHIQEQAPQDTGDQCINFLKKYESVWFAAFFHFRDPDKTGHLTREGSEAWLNSIKVDDQQLHRIIQFLNQTNELANTKIYITTDHGFQINGYSHPHEHNIWLLTNDVNLKINSKSNMVGVQDVAPTICLTLDLPYDSSEPGSGQPLQEPFTPQKIAYREQYFMDRVNPTVAILNTQNYEYITKVIVQLPSDVNQLYLITNSSDYQSSVAAYTDIALNTTTVIVEIPRILLVNHSYYILAYDVAENPSTPILIEYK